MKKLPVVFVLSFVIASLFVGTANSVKDSEGRDIYDVPFKAKTKWNSLPSVHTEINGQGKSVNTPLKGSLSNVYYLTIAIGTPPQTVRLQIDTGSSDLGVPSSTCTTCGGKSSYNPTKSSTSSSVSCSNANLFCPSCSTTQQCKYSITYVDQSGYTAVVYQDKVVAGNLTTTTYIGAITSEKTPNGAFEPPGVDGIIGVSFQDNSQILAPDFIDSLAATGKIANIFTMCLNRGPTTPVGGALTLGGEGPYKTGTYKYTPVIKSFNQYDFYTVNVQDMKVNGVSLGLAATNYNANGAIVDSGTNEFVVSVPVYNAIKQAFLNNCTKSKLFGVCTGVTSSNTLFDGICLTMTSQQVSAYPTISIVMGTGTAAVTINVPPQNYLVQGFCNVASKYALAIAGANGDGTIMGDVVMMGYSTVFDRVNHRVGFAPVSGCPSN